MADGFRILENGDIRITQSSDTRITENFVEAFASVSASSSTSSVGLITKYGFSDLDVLGSKISAAERTLFGYSEFNSTGTITDVVRMDYSGATSLTGTATLDPLGTGRSQAVVSLLGEASTNIYPNTTSLVFSSLQSVGSKLGIGTRIQFPTVNLVSAGAVSAIGYRSQVAESSLTTQGSKLSVGIRIQYGLFDKTSTGTLSPSAIKILNGSITTGTDEVTRITESGDIRVLENGTDTRTSIAAYGNIIFATIVGNPSKTLFSSEPYYKEVGTWRDMLPYVKWNGAWTNNIKIYQHTNGAWKRSY
jgi:hypothetical protein